MGEFRILVSYIFDFEIRIIPLNFYHSFCTTLELPRIIRKEKNEKAWFENLLTITKLLTGTMTGKTWAYEHLRGMDSKNDLNFFSGTFRLTRFQPKGLNGSFPLCAFFFKLQAVDWYLEERTQVLFYGRISVFILKVWCFYYFPRHL